MKICEHIFKGWHPLGVLCGRLGPIVLFKHNVTLVVNVRTMLDYVRCPVLFLLFM